MLFSSTVNPEVRTISSVTVLCHEGQRVLVLTPDTYEDLEHVAINKFRLLAADFQFETTTLDGCLGQSVLIDEWVWESVRHAVAVLTVVTSERSLQNAAASGLQLALPTPSSSRNTSDTGDRNDKDGDESHQDVEKPDSDERHADEGAVLLAVNADGAEQQPLLNAEDLYEPHPAAHEGEYTREDTEARGDAPVHPARDGDGTGHNEDDEEEDDDGAHSLNTFEVVIRANRASEIADAGHDSDRDLGWRDFDHGPKSRSPSPPRVLVKEEADAKPEEQSSIQWPVKIEPGLAPPPHDTGSGSQSYAQSPSSEAPADEVPRFKVHIMHATAGGQAFKTKSRHTVGKVLAGVCKAFRLKPDSARLFLIVEDGEGGQERMMCVHEETMGRTGATDGSKFIVEGEVVDHSEGEEEYE